MGKPSKVKFGKLTVLEVLEDTFAEQLADAGDIQVMRSPSLFQDDAMFEGMSYSEQASLANSMAKFFTDYALWIADQKVSEDPMSRRARIQKKA